jgi:hypothetical protein
LTIDFDAYRIDETSRFVTNLEDEVRSARPGDAVGGLDVIEGSDASGTVYCVVDLTGAIVQVGITNGWWHRVGAHGVANAVLQALQLAREKVGIAKLVLTRHGLPFPSPGPVEPLDEPERGTTTRQAGSRPRAGKSTVLLRPSPNRTASCAP